MNPPPGATDGAPDDTGDQGCRVCGGGPADTWLSGDGPLCDRCADRRLVAATGYPPLPVSPASAVLLTGPDGRTHRLRYRIFRAPTGISLRLVEDLEDGAPEGGGYEFEALGDHDADVDELAAALHTEAAAEIGRCYLERDHRDQTAGEGGAHTVSRWQVADLEVAGRFAHDPQADGEGPHGVIVDGRFLTWHELGQALSAFEGWRFRLLIDDPCLDLRT